MKTSIDFLPQHKQDELQQFVDYIEKYFHKKIDMIILYGSYARNTWVEDKYVENGTTYEYKSDFDIMLVPTSEKTARKRNFTIDLTNKVRKNVQIDTPLNIIFHGYDYICQMLAEKQYFFCDVFSEGIVLSNLGNRQFKEPKDISFKLRAEKASDYYEEWFESASGFLDGYSFYFDRAIKANENLRELKIASFQLHQAAERFYTCILLVFTDYKGKTHDLEILDKACSDEDSRFRQAFPRTTKEESDLFNLLKEAYIGSRYKKNFKITKEQLEYLVERVEVLKKLTDKVCNEKITNFKEVAERHPDKTIENKVPVNLKPHGFGSEMRRIDSSTEQEKNEEVELKVKEKQIEIAKSLLDVLDVETIAAKVGLSVEEIEKLKD